MNTGLDVSTPSQPDPQSAQHSSNTTKYVLITAFVSLAIVIFTGIWVYLWQQSQINTLKTKMQSEVNELKQNMETVVVENKELKQQAEKALMEKEKIEQKTCKGVWKNGICVQSSCVDSDVNEKPNDIYIKGSVTYIDENGASTTVYDECSDSKQQVNEMWCYESPSGSGNYVQGRMVYNCPNSCLDGACINK